MLQPQATTFVGSFLKHLQSEEELLRNALTSLSDVYAALRQGDLAKVATARSSQEQIAVALQHAEVIRSSLARDLGLALGISPGEKLTLSVIANHLPEPFAAEFRSRRQRLTDLTTGLAKFQGRNANLIGHLRSYFRGVMSALTGADTPVRYGSSGGRLTPGSSPALQARG